jgi:transposase
LPVLPMPLGRIERHWLRIHFLLDQVVAACPPQQEIHVILDNLSAHKTSKIQDFLGAHPNVQLHFTPTSSSWLNQVEIWFGRIEREVITRGVFTSIRDLARKLMR